jgi:hypothetical protein
MGRTCASWRYTRSPLPILLYQRPVLTGARITGRRAKAAGRLSLERCHRALDQSVRVGLAGARKLHNPDGDKLDVAA